MVILRLHVFFCFFRATKWVCSGFLYIKERCKIKDIRKEGLTSGWTSSDEICWWEKINDCGVACSVVTICHLNAIISFNPLCISFLQEKNYQTENDLCARASCTCNAVYNTNLLTLIVSISDCHYQMWYTDHRRCRRKDPPELYSHVACTHSMLVCANAFMLRNLSDLTSLQSLLPLEI